ncbi:hypothetical protein [Thermomonas brevis]
MPASILKFTAGLCLALVAIGHAGPARADDPVRTIYDIDLQPDARIRGGKSAFLQGTATPYGHQFQVQGTELDQPIAVGLYTKDPSHPLRLRVVKDSFMTPERELTTDARGRTDLHFRTYDGFKLWVAAEQPTDYQLVVWVGDDLPPAATPAAVVPASDYVAPQVPGKTAVPGIGGGWSTREIGLAAALALVVLIGGGIVVRHRKSIGGDR